MRVTAPGMSREERILVKLGVHSQLQALVFAARHGLVKIR